MGVHSHRARRALYIATGLACAITIVLTALDAEIKIYLTVWLYAIIANSWLLAAWLARPDHTALAAERALLFQARLKKALHEEDERPS